MKKTTLIKVIGSLVIVLAVVALFAILSAPKISAVPIIADVIVLCLTIMFMLFSIERIIRENAREIEDSLDGITKDVLSEANMGFVSFDEDYNILLMSNNLKELHGDKEGEKVLSWIPEIESIIKTGYGHTNIILNEHKYIISKKKGVNVILFNDYSIEYDLTLKSKQEAYVLGLINYDNYDEFSESEENISYINSNIKVPVIDYLKSFNIVYKTLKNNRLLLIMNEKQYETLLANRFSILNTVRNESKKADLLITLSMAFARGSSDLNELDELANDLLEIAETRGGDQVVSRKIGEEAMFYGGSTEAREKQSKVKARVIANTIKTLIQNSDNVIIAGHNNADSDAIGSAVCMSAIAKSLGKDAYIIYKPNSTEPMINEVYEKYKTELNERHHFVSENEAYNQLNNNSLLIMVDHHSASQSNASSLLSNATKVAIIDHHRRKADLDVNPLLLYVEAGASSTSELTAEFLPYLSRKNIIQPTEANLMYLGILVDTNHFRVRTDSRTFEVAKNLREYGADPALCEILSQESYETLKMKSEIIDKAFEYKENILISSLSDGIYPRSIASMACDNMIQTKGIKAAFVICYAAKDEVIVTARSKENFNVQIVMEQLNGGGHMSAAGLQRQEAKVQDVQTELISALEQYEA